MADAEGGRGSVIGEAIPDLSVYVLDAGLRVVPEGVCGEFYVGGAGLARGYLGRPALTAERFVPDPFSGEGGARLYRTGDVGRVRSGGGLEYVGRVDNQVKIRGFRIELGEVEAALSSHPAVRECVVVVRGESDGEKRLVAYVAGERERLGAGELRAHLKARLPEYMVPQAFAVLDALPLTENGKIDRKQLPEVGVERPELGREFAQPETWAERELAAVWTEVLGVGRVGVEDNFFELGGDSIRSIQVRAKAQQRGLSFTLQQLFQYQTIRKLARHLSEADGAEEEGRAEPFSLVSPKDRLKLPEGLEDAYPLTRLQAGMLFHSELNQDSAMYHNVATVQLGLKLDAEKLKQAVALLAARHPVLRTSFHLNEFSEPLQLVHREVEIPLQVHDLRHLTHERQEEKLSRWFEAEKADKFEWTRPPLIRFAVHRRGEETSQFSWTEHHAILDGWSVASATSELFHLYSTLLKGEGEVAPMPSVTFRDYVALERRALASEQSRDYWARHLDGATPSRLPRLTPPAQLAANVEPIRHEVHIPAEVSDGLKRLAAEAGVPVKSVLLAAHLRVMSLLTGRDDVVTGFVMNGRSEEEGGERVLGLFLNSLPMRLRLKGGTWTALAREVFEAEREGLPHRRYPLAEVQRVAGGEALFDALFNFIHFHVYDSVFEAEGMQPLSADSYEKSNYTMTSHFGLSLTNSQVKLKLVCDGTQLSESQVEAIGGYYRRALAAMAEAPAESYDSRPLLSEEERRRLLSPTNAMRGQYPSDTCVHQLFEEQARLSPGAVALTFEGRQMTYGALDARSSRLARRLRRSGVGPDSLVGLCAERSIDLVVGLLAILKAGGAYLPLDPSYPRERLEYMLEDSGACVLLAQSHLLDTLPSFSGQLLSLDDSEQPEADDISLALPIVTPENLAYVIYTSGSTGRPKGSLVTHANVSRLLRATEGWFDFSTSDVWTLFHSPSFDFSVWELWGALGYGGRLVVVPYVVSRSPDAFRRLLLEEGVTVLNQTPSAFRQLMRADEEAEAGGGHLSLRFVIFGGEALDVQSLRGWFDRHGDEWPRLVNMYGITETTVHVTYRPLSVRDLVGGAGSVIGEAIPDLSVYVLDQRQNLLPVGTPGELYVGGAGLARGYLNRPALTAERFVPNPFGDTPGERLYRSGDLACFLPNGDLEYMGRIDQQVKIRGFRIELGEIEAALSAHAAVRECAVLAREDEPGEKQLVAYVVADTDAAASTSELRTHLKGRLPEYMIPSAFVRLDSLPLTANGKLDRKALPAPDAERPDVEVEFALPRSPVEEVMARVWAEVLGLERVGAHDNFFELGGHSLRATQVTSRLREVFRAEINLRDLFERPTVAELSAHVERRLREAEGVETPPILRAHRGGALPLSFSQQRLWFLDQLEPGSPFYNSPVAVRLSGELNVGALERTLSEIVGRHEILRTTFQTRDGEPAQVVGEPYEVRLPVEDLGALPEQEREEEMRRLVTEETQRPFDLTRGPLLRVKLLRLAADDHVVVFTTHHIASDGWSLSILVREVATLYGAFAAGGDSPLAELPLQYADYAVWQRGWLQGEALERQLGYWRGRLGGAPTSLELRGARPRPPVQSFRGSKLKMSLPAELCEGLRELSRREGVTLYMTLLAAFQFLLARHSGQEDVLVGTAIANRNRAEIEGLIGFFVNTLVMRADLSGDPTFNDLLRQVREVTLGAYAHQDVPFEKVVEEVQPERSSSHTPLVQVAFGLQNAPLGALKLEGLRLNVVPFENEAVRFDLTVWMTEGTDGMSGTWTYSRDLFDEEFVGRLLRRYVRLLESVVAEPGAQLSALEMLTDEEKAEQARREKELAASAYKKFRGVKPKAFTVSPNTPAGAQAVAPPTPRPDAEEANNL
jgi:amino acid adenylation domain-containing protein